MNMIIRETTCRMMVVVLLVQWSGFPSFAAAYTLLITVENNDGIITTDVRSQ